jgi:hypothetical protein
MARAHEVDTEKITRNATSITVQSRGVERKQTEEKKKERGRGRGQGGREYSCSKRGQKRGGNLVECEGCDQAFR